jgi:orotate phosphoribosyltransferase
MLDNERARLLQLVKEKALLFGDITLSSGQKSNWYVDGRLITLSAEGSYLLGRTILSMLEGVELDAIGGTTLGADPMVAAVAALSFEAGRPINAFIVRKEPKGHGTGRLIEGPLQPGARVCIVDDAVTTAGSMFHAIAAAEEFGCKVVKVIGLLDREQGGGDELRRRGYDFSAVFTRHDLGMAQP